MAYNKLGLRSLVRAKIKDSSYSADAIDGYVYDAICEIADLYPWKYFQKLVSGALTVGEHTYEQQDDHQITSKLILLHPTNTKSFWDITRYRKPWEEFFRTFPAPDRYDNSQPIYWTEHGDQLYFNCPANLPYILRQFYQKTPTELVSDIDVPELPQSFQEVIVLGASYRCEEERDNYDIAMMLENRFGTRVASKITRFVNDTMAGPDTVVMPKGMSHDEWDER